MGTLGEACSARHERSEGTSGRGAGCGGGARGELCGACHASRVKCESGGGVRAPRRALGSERARGSERAPCARACGHSAMACSARGRGGGRGEERDGAFDVPPSSRMGRGGEHGASSIAVSAHLRCSGTPAPQRCGAAWGGCARRGAVREGDGREGSELASMPWAIGSCKLMTLSTLSRWLDLRGRRQEERARGKGSAHGGGRRVECRCGKGMDAAWTLGARCVRRHLGLGGSAWAALEERKQHGARPRRSVRRGHREMYSEHCSKGMP